MGVSFETCLGRCEDVPLRRLSDVPLRRRWVFHLRRTCDVTGTYRETSLRRHYDVLLPGGILVMGKMPKISLKTGFLDFCQKINPSMFLFLSKNGF